MNLFSTKEPLLIIDGSSYLYRAYHSMPKLTSKGGTPTGALTGVRNMILSTLQAFPSKKVVFLLDAGGITFRHKLYREYKANREEMPEDLKQQVPLVKELLKLIGIPLLCIKGVEADDVIATLVRKALRRKLEVIISTGDKDIAQLLDDDVTLINTMTSKTTTVSSFIRDHGYHPKYIVDYLSIVGDKVDNVPGIKGLGDVTARSLIVEFNTIENLYQNIDKINSKKFGGRYKLIIEKLQSQKEECLLSKQLIILNNRVRLPLTVPNLVQQGIEEKDLSEFLSNLSFKQ